MITDTTIEDLESFANSLQEDMVDSVVDVFFREFSHQNTTAFEDTKDFVNKSMAAISFAELFLI